MAMTTAQRRALSGVGPTPSGAVDTEAERRSLAALYFFVEGASAVTPVPTFCWPVYSDVTTYYTPTVSGGSYVAALPVTNVLDADLSLVARTTNALVASTTFTIDLTRACGIGAAIVPWHTMSVDATARWEGANLSDFSVLEYDSGSFNAWPVGTTLEATEGIHVACVHVLSAVTLARYWRFTATDTANSAGSVDFARALLTGVYQPGYATETELGWEEETVRTTMQGGADQYHVKPARRVMKLAFQMLDEADAMTNATKMKRQLGKAGHVFYVHATTDAWQHERSFLGTFDTLTPMQYVAGTVGRQHTGYILREVLG